MSKKILLFDGLSILNRAFYALPLLSSPSGEYTNAVYGFLNIFFRFCDEETPDYITVAFDLPQPTFRHERYGAYKGTRKGMPDELRSQVPILKGLLEKMQIHVAECPGYEADDILGTLTAKAQEQDITPVIISGDRDLLQLASDVVRIRLPKTKAGKTEVEDYFADDVLAKYGVTPKAFIDVKALMGDASDNVPGVPGIGEVTATKIIAAHGSLEAALAKTDEIKPKKAAENLVQFREQALLSQMLVTIVQDAPVPLQLCEPKNIQNDQSRDEIKRLGLKSLYKRFEILPAAKPSHAPAAPLDPVKIVKTSQEIEEIFRILAAETTALCFLWDDAAVQPQLVGIGLAAAGIPPTYIATAGELSLVADDGICGAQLLNLARTWLESDSPKLVYDLKAEIRRLRCHEINLRGVRFDIMLAAYVLDPLRPNKTPSDVFALYLGTDIPTMEDILGNKGKRGKDRRTVADIPSETAADYAAGVAEASLRTLPIMEQMLAESNQVELYKNMELPLAYVLANMESTGIKVDRVTLAAYGKILDTRINQLTQEIHLLAGEEFNINSPAQLGVILFEKLGLIPGGKKNQKAGYSTAADVLEKMSNKHPIIPLVLEYRAHAKLKSTYVEGLLPLISGDSRIHSTFHQALTATGRLSSSEPNLQNIPVRMQLGRELRKAFVPHEGCVFIDADYSHIELRLLAHMSGDDVLITAFRHNQDIHRITASQVFGVDPADVTAEQRNNAKAVNFGIVYGISAYGLSDDLSIPVKEAEKYIAGYFAKYPGVKAYLDETINRAKHTGYVETLYNRRRFMPELKSSNYNTRSFGERVAMNMPIQGTAADIVKIAMLNVSRRLENENLAAKMVLQVHDELLLESPEGEVQRVTHLLKEEMENAARLSVPLVADVNVGDSWYATK